MTSRSLTGKRILYTLCFVGFCVIDQIKGSATGRVQMTAVNCMGFLMAAIILSAYHWKDFLKLPYFIWTGLFAVGGIIAYQWGRTNYPYQGRWITAILNVGVYGYILIRLWYKFVMDKEKLRVNKVLFALWCVMLLCMLFSRNEAIWPLWFLVMFGSFYVTDYQPEVRKVLFDSMIDGLIVGFFLIQGAAFLFRPFDYIRYVGMYANANMNALFYAVVYCALLCKLCQLQAQNMNKILIFLVTLVTGMMLDFAFLTMGRAGLLTMMLSTVLFAVYSAVTLCKKKILIFLYNSVGLVCIAIVCFPLVFGAVRYVPAYVHHPIWFEGEYSAEKVNSMDPVNSDKYTDWDEFMESSVGRMLWFVNSTQKEVTSKLKFSIIVHAAENVNMEQISQPVLTEQDEINNPAIVRKTIFKYYADRINLFGHKSSENGFWLTETYYAPHAHNIILQLAYDFGIVSVAMFVGLASYMICVIGKNLTKKTNVDELPYILMMLLITVLLFSFGMLELDWNVGQNSVTLYFFIQYILFHMGRYDNHNDGDEFAFSM